ncbi:MAG: 30S ribosomal protein S3 [Methanosphaera sp. SHI613]|jgi:small subunit ribosomal protein S3|nr:MAG: 30S ribosomal protein S3 [Methanosphaera sp. SHI613]
MIEKDFVREGLKRTRIDEYLETKLERAGYGGMDIQVTPVGTIVLVYAEKPGMVIGRGGKTVRSITKTLKNDFDLENPQVEVKEVEVAELNPRIMANKISSMLERGMHFRRVAYSIIRRIMGAGAQGVEVTISGKIRGSRSACAKFNEGYIKKCGEPSIKHVKEGFATAQLKPGVLGVYVRIMPPEVVLPDYIEIAEPVESDVAKTEETVEETQESEIVEEITGEDILDEITEEAETEEITEEEADEGFIKEHIQKFEDEIIPKIKENLDKLNDEEEKIYQKITNKEELSSMEPSAFSKLKEKVEAIHLKFNKSE